MQIYVDLKAMLLRLISSTLMLPGTTVTADATKIEKLPNITIASTVTGVYD